MAHNALSQRLEEYTRALILGGSGKAQLYAGPILPEEESLFHTIDLLWRNLKRVTPEPEFRDTLYKQLLTEARRQQTKQHLGFYQTPEKSPAPWVAPAAVVGAATLAGAFAYWRWAVSRQAA